MGTMTRPTINGKPLQIVATASVAAATEENPEIIASYGKAALAALEKCPVDMIVFEKNQVRAAGYDLATDSKLDEKTVIMETNEYTLLDSVVWFKLDNYGDRYVGTFLFPSDY